MWILVLVYLLNNQPFVEKINEYDSMYSCFEGFDYYEPRVAQSGTQLVCVKGDADVTWWNGSWEKQKDNSFTYW